MIVMKFGGTSVGSADVIKRTADLVANVKEDKVVVVSAMSGITNLLISAANRAEEGDPKFRDDFNEICRKEKEVMQLLFNHSLANVGLLLKELNSLLNGVFVLGELTKRALDAVQSFGERISVCIVSEAFKQKSIKAVSLNATKFLVTTDEFGNAFPIFEKSKPRAEKLFSRFFKEGITPVVTGFIGATEKGQITTLGRGGSDFSATIIGRLLDAREVWIWTDVDGVMSADPKVVRNARSLEEISYNEASELSYFGARVIHPKALLPVIDKKIPVRILNTFNPSFKGTLIADTEKNSGFIKAITRIKDISLINVNGKGMLGVPGIAARVFKCAAETNSNILMISQSSSEQNICFATNADDARNLIKKLKLEFKEEIGEGVIENVKEEKKSAIVSAVGSKIKSSPGISGKIFSILGRNGINVSAITQGSSEYNISFVVKERMSVQAMNVLHAELGLDNPKFREKKIVNIFQLGVGSVGSALYSLIEKNREKIAESSGIEIRYAGIARSRGYVMNEVEKFVRTNGFNFKENGAFPEKRILSLPLNTVIVDVTNSDQLTDFLLDAINRGLHVVTSNKKNLVSFDKFKALTNGKGTFKFETTVGAALPVIKTIKSLIESGDKIREIIALPSGSLSFIFHMFNKGNSIKEALSAAEKNHFTEPNPMDDLKGVDIFRKATILLHVLGRDGRIKFREFVSSAGKEEFFTNEIDTFEEKLKKLRNNGMVYPAMEISESGAEITLKAFGENSSFYSIAAGENIFEIYTDRYGSIPIVIKGIGAGSEITASGVLNDIIDIGREL
jgi:aspartokinase/homoserine dehydrogenase 1